MKQTFVVNYKAGLSEIFTMEVANAALGDATAINSNNTDVIEIRELVNFGLSNVTSFGTITVQYNKYTIKYTDWNISVMFYDNDVELFNHCLEIGIEECMECISRYEVLNNNTNIRKYRIVLNNTSQKQRVALRKLLMSLGENICLNTPLDHTTCEFSYYRYDHSFEDEWCCWNSTGRTTEISIEHFINLYK